MIEKTNNTYNKKPAFRWIGIHGVHDFVRELREERLLNGLEEKLPEVKVLDKVKSSPSDSTSSTLVLELPKLLSLKRTFSESNTTTPVQSFRQMLSTSSSSNQDNNYTSLMSRILNDEDKEND